jgi:hypothetical protein
LPTDEPQAGVEPSTRPTAAVALAPAADPVEAFSPPPAPEPVPAPVGAPTPARTTGAARALQQQGVRKRRDVDLNALARRDTSYALHELRRIGILAATVVVTLVVLGIVMR